MRIMQNPNPEMFGIAKGRNIIAISLESLQSFVINEEMNGHVITPFLNELTKDPDTFYFIRLLSSNRTWENF